MRVYNLTVMGKPRMTRSDAWRKRPCVLRYRAMKDLFKDLAITYAEGEHMIFVLPMAKSWSKKKKRNHEGKPHRQKPDLDNLIKSVWDCLFEDDSHFANVSAEKIWGYEGKLLIGERNER